MKTEYEQFGRYKLLRYLAAGGMAEIYKAEFEGALGFKKEVVIKRIHENLRGREEFIQMFVNEAKISALLNHPNIVQVTDFNEVEGRHYIAMEYIDGTDLRELLTIIFQKKIYVPIEVFLFIISEALEGLDYAHQRRYKGASLNIVHRDISPHNILISYEGQVKLTDFGIAKMKKSAHLTAQGVLKGKSAYMSPEQTQSSQVDALSDIFAMGIILWEALTQRRLFRGQSELHTIQNVRQKLIPSPQQYNPQVSSSLAKIVLKALERDRQGRFQSAKIFAKALQTFFDPYLAREKLKQLMQEQRAAKELFTRKTGAQATFDSFSSDRTPSHEDKTQVSSSNIHQELTSSSSTMRGSASFAKMAQENELLGVSREDGKAKQSHLLQPTLQIEAFIPNGAPKKDLLACQTIDDPALAKALITETRSLEQLQFSKNSANALFASLQSLPERSLLETPLPPTTLSHQRRTVAKIQSTPAISKNLGKKRWEKAVFWASASFLTLSSIIATLLLMH